MIKNITTTYGKFELRAIHAQEKNAPWEDGKDRTHCHYIIRVKDVETKKIFVFDYWTSLANPIINSNVEILKAFELFLDDCLIATDTVENFIYRNEFKSEKEARRIYATCTRSLRKMQRLYDESIVDLANNLSTHINNLTV